MERVGFSIAFTEMAKEAGTSEAVKGAVMSAFYWGYAFSQVRLLAVLMLEHSSRVEGFLSIAITEMTKDASMASTQMAKDTGSSEAVTGAIHVSFLPGLRLLPGTE